MRKGGFVSTPGTEVVALRGDTVKFECELVNDSDEVEWFINDKSFAADARATEESKGPLRILTIRDLVPKDTGMVVEVRLGDNVATSTLTVEDTLAEITKRLERKTTGKEGESVVLSVELDHEPKEVAWFKDEKPILNTEKLHITIEETVCILTIDRADYHDSGQYTVIVDGSKCYTNLQILSKPLVKPVERGVVEVERDENIMINVAFECHEEPTITCLFNGSPLREDAKTLIEVHESVVRFTKKHVTKADSGEYTVKLSNEIGEGSETITVRVKDVPDKPSNISVTDIDSEAITITWSPPEDDGGQPITGYVIEKKEDGRRTFHKVAQVGTHEAPQINEAPVISDVTETGCTLTWSKPAESGGSPIYGYDVYKKEDGGDWIKVEAHNEAGFVSTSNVESEPLLISPTLGRPTTILNVPRIIITDDDSVIVEWDVPDDEPCSDQRCTCHYQADQGRNDSEETYPAPGVPC
ncbi:immunoglobulin I-set domain protein [Ancylostoma ceylanicum]|uniref:Immunoglobulin I-set domain protein n=1 Tax=Ancylostoma ceylanicum TaxID=53326 RepID=A0A0D6L8B9_9BILA|nr:immunoglobulin I-set domain protein [Ancylostoma ceylanicum]